MVSAFSVPTPALCETLAALCLYAPSSNAEQRQDLSPRGPLLNTVYTSVARTAEVVSVRHEF